MTPSFFGRLTRFQRGLINPTENQVTEVTAAVLETVDGLATDFVTTILDLAKASGDRDRRLADFEAKLTHLGPDARPSVATQVLTQSGRWVDLELQVHRNGDPSDRVILWVEVKHRAGIHGDQLHAYVRDLPTEPGAGLVVVLGPRDGLPTELEIPLGMPRVAWQSLARELASTADDASLKAEQQFLLCHYLQYLKEEGLMDDEVPLRRELISSLEYRDESDRAAAALCRRAAEALEDRWGKPSAQKLGNGQPHYGFSYWATYPPALGDTATTEEATKFEWGLTQLPDNGGPSAWGFAAGISADPKSGYPLNRAEQNKWLADRTRKSGGFRLYDSQRPARLYRHLPLTQLLDSRSTLEEQSQYLVAWIGQVFSDLAVAPPPGRGKAVDGART